MNMNKLVRLNHDVFCGVCDAYNLLILLVRLRSICFRQLVNYCFIILLEDYMCSFYCGDDFMMIMIFSVKMVNNKVVDNLLIYLVLDLHSHRSYGLKIIAVRSLLSEMLALWTDLRDWLFDLDNYWITLRWLKESCRQFHKLSRKSTTILFWCV